MKKRLNLTTIMYEPGPAQMAADSTYAIHNRAMASLPIMEECLRRRIKALEAELANKGDG